MVQLSPSLEDSGDQQEDLDVEEDSSGGLEASTSTSTSTSYHGYDTYIEDGLICLQHKVRNLEKKKLKLEDYQKRLIWGEELNQDQMAAVEKYQEVLHHLAFAQELHKTLDDLTQDLLAAQRTAVKKEQAVQVETERRRLSTVLQVQQLLLSVQQEDVRRDLLDGLNQAPHVTAPLLDSLSQLAVLLGVHRDTRLSLKEQMEKAAVIYLDLLEGKEKPVVGSTFKLLKEELTRLLNFSYFSCPPPPPAAPPAPPPSRSPEGLLSSSSLSASSKSRPKDVSKELFSRLYPTTTESPPTQRWKGDLQTTRDREPPDRWDMDLPDGPASPQAAVHKPWRGAATLIPRVTLATNKHAHCKQRKDRRAKREQHAKSAVVMDTPVEVYNSPYALPKDPVLRRQHLEDLITKIHGSFTFMQDSLLDGETSPTNGRPRLLRRPSGSPALLDDSDLMEAADVLPKVMHSTPVPTRLKESRASLTDVDQCLEICDLQLSSEDLPQEELQPAERKKFPSPPLYRREPTTSTPVPESGKQSPCNGGASRSSTPPQGQTFSTPPTRRTLTSAHFHNIQSVFKASLPQNGELNYQPDFEVFDEPGFSSASTQTPPEFAPSEDELQPGGSYTPQAHLRDPGPLLYAARDSGYQHSYRRGGGGRHNSSAWSESSQVSTPDREGGFTLVDSGHGDSLSVSTLEVPLTPHGHHHALLPMQLYPLSRPLRVAFNASRTANFAPGNLDQPIVFDQLHSNLGEMYDTHIGRFTCPANGTYVFLFHILKLATNIPLYINLMRNEEVVVSAYANDGAPDHETASNHAILPLFQGDQVWLRLHRGAIYGSTWKYSTFSGFLLYQG
ncbi:caprin-2 isoform X2 [Sebastes fasciatus]|uniref:caprin-2 isoform X2 n=1 Tax=Sebastes fasciatus TaxID=394691 RepID=UPI003D9EE631